MGYDTLLALLQKPRKATPREGQTRANRACCPICSDANNTKLSVAENGDGSVLAHCFSCGASGVAICEALGVDPSALFPTVSYAGFGGSNTRNCNGPLGWASVAALSDAMESRAAEAAIALHATGNEPLALNLLDAALALKTAAREAMRTKGRSAP